VTRDRRIGEACRTPVAVSWWVPGAANNTVQVPKGTPDASSFNCIIPYSVPDSFLVPILSFIDAQLVLVPCCLMTSRQHRSTDVCRLPDRGSEQYARLGLPRRSNDLFQH
jgi:hypothetical protein